MSASAAAPQQRPRFERETKMHIAEGTFGRVYAGVDNANGDRVCIKVLRVRTKLELKLAEQEAALLKTMDHPHVVRFIAAFLSSPDTVNIVMELMDRDLASLIATYTIPVLAAKNIAYQLLTGIAGCHARGVVHRDLKPANVMVKDSVVKIADFGLATMYKEGAALTPGVITLWYRAPEVLLAQAYNRTVDVWSAGVILWELLTGSPPFRGDSAFGQLFEIFSRLGTPTEATMPGYSACEDYTPVIPSWPRKPWARLLPLEVEHATDLMSLMLCYDPNTRISAADALKHPFFTGVGDMAEE